MYKNLVNEFHMKLEERYIRLYGEKNCKTQIAMDKKGLKIKGMAVIGLLCIMLLSSLFSDQNSKGIQINEAEEITAVIRPDEGEESLSFPAEVELETQKGVMKKDCYITIEPVGDKDEKQVSVLENSPEEKREAELKRLISGLNTSTELKKVKLPKKLSTGEKLTWKQAADSNWALYVTAVMIALFFLYKMRFYTVERMERQAKASIIRELPEFINKMVLLLSAGSVLSTAFIKIVEDYRQYGTQKTYFSEQMEQICRTVQETNGSLHEELCSFAKRSGVKEFMRVANVISDNISKGTDLSDQLRKENDLLWFARKQQSEEKGRLAETKLTMPLMILLLVLIMITIAPALMEI